jgi:hypothetical protein
MPLAWEYNNMPVSRKTLLEVPSHVCGGNPQYSRYYKSCRLCMIRKTRFKLQQPNLNQRSKIIQPCINEIDEFTYLIKFEEFLQRSKLNFGLIKI